MKPEDLPMTEFPFIVEYVGTGVFTYRALATMPGRKYAREYAAAVANRSSCPCAVVLAADDCVQASADGTVDEFIRFSFDGIGVREDVVPRQDLPLGAKRPKPSTGVEIHRDDDGRKVWTGEYDRESDRWQIVRHELDKNGMPIQRREYQGGARGFYHHAQELGIRIDDLREVDLPLPSPWETYDGRRDELLRGKRFMDEIDGEEVGYSVARNRGGWWLFVIFGDGAGDDPLDEPPCSEHGPFRTKVAVRNAMTELGLKSEVEF